MAGCGRRSRPDAILVTLDTTRADHIGAHGYHRPITPEIDRFSRDAVLFRKAWFTAGRTLPAPPVSGWKALDIQDEGCAGDP
jgi:arylsulfatase A-like enzyme